MLVGGKMAEELRKHNPLPFEAHVLSVLYYRLVEPERPAIDPQVRSWPSVWAGPIPEHV